MKRIIITLDTAVCNLIANLPKKKRKIIEDLVMELSTTEEKSGKSSHTDPEVETTPSGEEATSRS